MQVKITNKSRHDLPKYETSGSSGMDIRANIDETVCLKPMQRTLIKTGLYLEMETSIECQIRPRSGLALKKGLTVLNTPGTVDADYRGEIGVILINLSDADVLIEDGERIAQMVFCPVQKITLTEVTELTDSARGAGGFGSTGLK
ncbi:MAG: dUTP diphosphatase [Crocinitomicaceae bacterium]|jgi:dUTP pyrophosphatase